MRGAAERLHGLLQHLGNETLAGPRESANHQESRVQGRDGHRRHPARNRLVSVQNPRDRVGKVGDHVVRTKEIFPVLSGVAGANEDGFEPGASPGLDVRRRIAHNP